MAMVLNSIPIDMSSSLPLFSLPFPPFEASRFHESANPPNEELQTQEVNSCTAMALLIIQFSLNLFQSV
jgi:hypothetical protein